MSIIPTRTPADTPLVRSTYLARNRLIAGLSGGVLVVEAGNRSGALNTASWARQLGLSVFAVPGPVFALPSVGCHKLIASGEAELVWNAQMLVERVGPIGLFAPDEPDLARELDSLSPDQGRIHGALTSRKAKSIAEISRSSGLAANTVLAELALLELGGLAKEAVDGGWTRA